jgi:hypothetical protein
MSGSLSRLLSGIIDYAGLFPPAKLDLVPAVENYLHYIHGPEKWITGRFVCAASKLPDLARELAEHPEEPFVPVAVVGSASKDRHEWEHALSHDAQAMNKFLEDADGHAEIETFEIKVPDTEHLAQYAVDLRGFNNVDVFVELPWNENLNDGLALLAETEWLGAKGRTGGLEAAAFPSSQLLAGFLQGCANLDLQFKLTAGLHHPFPRQDPDTGGRMHGFLNVAAALALLHGNDLTQTEIAAILDENDPRAFSFSAGVTWRWQEASADDLQAVREIFVSFGSCSIEEPLEDLSQAGLISEAVGS